MTLQRKYSPQFPCCELTQGPETEICGRPDSKRSTLASSRWQLYTPLLGHVSMGFSLSSTWVRTRRLTMTGFGWNPRKMVRGGLASAGMCTTFSSMSLTWNLTWVCTPICCSAILYAQWTFPQIPVTYPTTAPEIALPELDGKTAKMYRYVYTYTISGTEVLL